MKNFKYFFRLQDNVMDQLPVLSHLHRHACTLHFSWPKFLNFHFFLLLATKRPNIFKNKNVIKDIKENGSALYAT